MSNEIQLFELLHRLSRKLGKTMTPVFHNRDLSHSEIAVMFIVNRKRQSRVIELANIIGLPASTLSGVLDRLVAQGYLDREPDPGDRRSFLITATPKLRRFIRDVMTPMKLRLHAVFQSMADSRIQNLIKDMRYILERLDHLENESEKKNDAAQKDQKDGSLVCHYITHKNHSNNYKAR
jgi:DNA-binding MarR family transcriptional regulator